MRLALSLLAFSALAAADGNVDSIWSNSPKISNGDKKLLGYALYHTQVTKDDNIPFLCYQSVSSLCTKSTSGVTTYMFGLTGCIVPTAAGACAGTKFAGCTPSNYLVQVLGKPKVAIHTVKVSASDILPYKCDVQAQLIPSTLLYWMYLLLWGSLMRNIMSKFVLLIVNTLTSCCFR